MSANESERRKNVHQEFRLFQLKDISTYRAPLMGWSIVWIMMLHFTFTQIKPLGFIAQYGFAGVEIFMLVSGLGLFYSLDKGTSIASFYKKRLFRIFPTYYIIGAFSSLLIFHDNFLTYLFRYTTIGYWTAGEYGDWYIPAIIFLYLIAPLVKWMFDSKQYVLIAFACVLPLVAAYLLINRDDMLDRSHFFLLYRIPAFILGMACAYWMKKHVGSKYFYALLVAGIPLFVLLFPHHHQVYNYKYFSLLFLLPCTIIAFVMLSKLLKPLLPTLTMIGNASLEIYLIQSIFFSAMLRGMIPMPAAWHDLMTVTLIIASTLLGIAAHWLIDRSGILRLL